MIKSDYIVPPKITDELDKRIDLKKIDVTFNLIREFKKKGKEFEKKFDDIEEEPLKNV